MGNRSLQVLSFFLTNERKGFSGAEISSATSIKSGTLYPLLAKFEQRGILESEWENIDPSIVGRPRRRFYTLTALGANAAQHEIKKVFDTGVPLQQNWKPA